MRRHGKKDRQSEREPVCAATVTRLTSSGGFAQGKIPPAPSVQELTARIRADLAARAAAEAGPAPRDARLRDVFNKKSGRAEQLRKDFERVLADVPAGFSLVPAFYMPVQPQDKSSVDDQFVSVRRRFLAFLAEHHAADLRALGIDDAGVDCMKKGMDPVSAAGEPYAVNTDHIVERSGSGRWGSWQPADPLQDDPGNETLRVNHFSNLILLPEEVHERKNRLHRAQDMRPARRGMWILTLAPERTAARPAFVCPPQARGLSFREKTPAWRMTQATATLRATLKALNGADAQDPVQAAAARAAIAQAAARLSAASRALAAEPDTPRNMNLRAEFAAACGGATARTLAARAEKLPGPETQELLENLDAVRKRFGGPGAREP